MSDKKVGLPRSAGYEQAFRLLMGASTVLYNQVSSIIDIRRFQRRFDRAETPEKKEAVVTDLQNKIKGRTNLKAEEKAKDTDGKVMDAIKEDRDRIKLEKNPTFKKEVKEREEKIQTAEEARKQAEKNALELEQKRKQELEATRKQALEEGIRQGETELGQRLEGKLDALREDVRGIRKKIKSYKKGKYKTREIKEYKIRDEQQQDGKIGGLGLSTNQRSELKNIIKKEAGEKYANALDLISGDDIKASDLLNGLIGIALSAVVPIPAPIIARMSNVLMTNLGVDINDYFEQISVGEGENEDIILLSTPKQIEEAELMQVNPFARNNNVEQEVSDQMAADRKENGLPKAAEIEPPKKGRKKRMINAAQTGAMIGMTVGSNIVGGPIAGVIGLGAGAAIGVGTELVSRTELPRIAEQVSQRIIDATPRLPTVEGVRRGVRRAITTDRKELRFNVPELGYRTEQETKDILEKKATELISAIQSANNKELRESLTNQYIAITSQIDMIDEFGLQPYDQDRLTIRQRERRSEIPILRRTTDEEKALVPFEEDTERMSKEKSLAVMGAAGTAMALGGAYKMRDSIPSFFREEPV
jgi:hypothetical protein